MSAATGLLGVILPQPVRAWSLRCVSEMGTETQLLMSSLLEPAGVISLGIHLWKFKGETVFYSKVFWCV